MRIFIKHLAYVSCLRLSSQLSHFPRLFVAAYYTIRYVAGKLTFPQRAGRKYEERLRSSWVGRRRYSETLMILQRKCHKHLIYLNRADCNCLQRIFISHILKTSQKWRATKTKQKNHRSDSLLVRKQKEMCASWINENKYRFIILLLLSLLFSLNERHMILLLLLKFSFGTADETFLRHTTAQSILNSEL